MRVACPHCGELVEVATRHGLSGGLCPACHELVPAPQPVSAPPAAAAPPSSKPPREEPWSGCEGCGGARDREVRRCPRCGDSWLFRVMAEGVESEERLERLAEYVAKRQTRAEPRARLRKRLGRPPTEVLGQLTEAQARRVRQEVEAFGVRARLERDPTVADADPAAPRLPGWLLAFAGAAAVALLAAGVYLFLDPFEPPAGPPPPSPPAPPSLAGAPASGDPGAPVDVLAGLARPGAAAGLAFFVDPDGWAVAPLRVRDGAGGTALRTESGVLRAALARADEAVGLGLFHAPARAPYALSFGDATLLAPGAKLYVPVATANSLHLVPDAVVTPNHRVGREVFLRLALDPGPAADGAPVFNADGLVVGVYDHALTRRAGVPLAATANALTEGPRALMGEIVPPRAPSDRRREWLEAARAADRAERPALYDLAEDGLVTALSCHPAGCAGHVGVVRFDEAEAPPEGPLEALYFAPEQTDDGAAPAYGRRLVALDAGAWGPAGGALTARLPEAVRPAITAGEARLAVAAVSVARPEAAGGGPFRLVLQGLAGRRAAPVHVDAVAPAPASIAPGAERFGPFTGEEWRARLQRLVGETEAARVRLADLRRAASDGNATPGTRELLERESRQLAILQQRLSTLLAEADTYHVPPQFRP